MKEKFEKEADEEEVFDDIIDDLELDS